MTQAVASFDVTGWDQGPPESEGEGPTHSGATVLKEFQGDLEGQSRAKLLMCTADATDLAAGAGYVASEVVTGRLSERTGTFVMQHWGVSGADGQRTGGHIVPGSGTEDLSGLSGTIEISVDADGAHTLTMDYELPD